MRTFEARVFLERSEEHWPCGPLERFNCSFEDGVVLEVTTPRMEFTARWWAIHRLYDKLPIKHTHYIGNDAVPWNTLANLMSDIYKTMYEVYPHDSFCRESLWKLMYRNVNDIYNDSIVRYKKYTRSVNSFDFNQLYHHPRMVEIRNNLRPNALSIEKAYKEAKEFLLTDKSLRLNPVISDAKCGIAVMEQLSQMLVCRGYNTDIDDFIYNTPIMGNYYEGIHDPAEAVMDSTLASKAYIYQGAPLERTEYGNRKLQFSAGRVDLLIMGDCKTPLYAEIEIVTSRVSALDGMYFKHPKTGKLTAFETAEAPNYLGQVLEFRTAIYCGWRDQTCVCSTCYGTLSRNIPYGTNIGIVASVNTQSEVSQRVLKVKHVESLTTHEPMVLSDGEKQFILNDTDSAKIRFNPRIAKDGVKLLIRSEAKDKIINGSRLPVLTKRDLDPQQSMARHSQFRDMLFEFTLPSGRMDRRRVTVSKGSMSSYLTVEFLRWFVDQDFRIDSDGFYRIDLSTWDFNLPALELPKKHMSMKDFSTEVEVFIRSSSDSSSKHLGKLKQLSQYTDLTAAMLDMYDLISSRVGVHMTHVSVMCLSMLVDAESKNDSRIPPIDRPAAFAKYSRIISEGSFSVIAAYQGGNAELMKLEQFLNTDRKAHLLDPLFMP